MGSIPLCATNYKSCKTYLNRPATFTDTAFRRIELPDEEVAFSHLNWNLPLAYGIKL